MNEAELSAGLSATPQYRYADRLGDHLFVAGQVPLDSDGQLVGREDPSTQALQCFATWNGSSQYTHFTSRTFDNWSCTWSEIKQVSLRHGQRSPVGLAAKFRQLPCSVLPDWATWGNS